MRNVFENNAPPADVQASLSPNDKVVTLLPALPEGERYELVEMITGRVAVLILKG